MILKIILKFGYDWISNTCSSILNSDLEDCEFSWESLLFVITSFGGVVSWERDGAPFEESNRDINYQVPAIHKKRPPESRYWRIKINQLNTDLPLLHQHQERPVEPLVTETLLFQSKGLVHEECMAKIRLMSIIDLAFNESAQVPYSLIKETLKIEDEQVEPWVVKAITAKLVDCKIDQMNKVIRMSHCTERVFGLLQWQALREKLATWRVCIWWVSVCDVELYEELKVLKIIEATIILLEKEVVMLIC
ncbi:hypothetical protein SSX86_031092 [Deinandra increscens subsp. villosa]|uniref:PCI domain-containing protein n=1 Tax=Deinandra increscens subsp. villosa TaxID=3103831 RepID=A0AAP0C4M1_9ASTR